MKRNRAFSPCVLASSGAHTNTSYLPWWWLLILRRLLLNFLYYVNFTWLIQMRHNQFTNIWDFLTSKSSFFSYFTIFHLHSTVAVNILIHQFFVHTICSTWFNINVFQANFLIVPQFQDVISKLSVVFHFCVLLQYSFTWFLFFNEYFQKDQKYGRDRLQIKYAYRNSTVQLHEKFIGRTLKTGQKAAWSLKKMLHHWPLEAPPFAKTNCTTL